MFDLEQAIAEWRRQMQAAGIKSQAALEELENHLREDIGKLRSSGMAQTQAFQTAVTRVGEPIRLRAEFEQIKDAPCRAVSIGAWLWVGSVMAMVLFLSRSAFAGRMGLLLFAHTVSLTAGYAAAFLAGGLGIYHVWHGPDRALTPSQQRSLGSAAQVFTEVAAGLTVTGFVLGMFWSRQHLGGWLAGGARELGTMYAAVWLTGLAVIHRTGRVNESTGLLLCIGGNVIISLAWFGAGIIASGTHGVGMMITWPLVAFLIVQFAFIARGLRPASGEIAK